MPVKYCEIVGLREFRDIIVARRFTSDILWASKRWAPNAVYNVLMKSSWSFPNIILNSYRLYDILQELSEEKGIDIQVLKSEARKLLIEITYRRVEPVLRWLAFFAAKTYKQLFTSIYVNEVKILTAKSQMGSNPVLLLPTHKSYIDFTLISYLCFHYNMDIPKIAAGMDFHSMKFVERLLRDSCAFFMRRTFSSDKLYSSVFSQYVHTLVMYQNSPIEFFIEGTRSRTEKSLVPKYGFLTMTMLPFLMGKIPDITIIPINISYERVLEELLHVYELLGVPKPKETTKGLLKAFRLLKSSYGNIFLQFGESISVKEFFDNKKVDRSIHNYGPVDLQKPTAKELDEVQRLANAIVRKQQNLTILTCFNLTATVMNHHMTECATPLSLDDLVLEVAWLVDIFRKLGVKVAVGSDIASSVSEALALHQSFVNITTDRKVKLLRIHSSNGKIDRSKMKAHPLSEKAMDIAIPLSLVQYYSNPCAHFLVNLAIITSIIDSIGDQVSIDSLWNQFKFLRSVYTCEFVLYPETEKEDFESAFEFVRKENGIVRFGTNVRSGENMKLRTYCMSFFRNYILSYIVVIDVILKGTEREISPKSIQEAYQEHVESSVLLGSNIHPASLSLDLVANAVQSFVRLGALKKIVRGNIISYEIHPTILNNILDYLRKFSHFYKVVDVSEHFSNFVMGKL